MFLTAYSDVTPKKAQCINKAHNPSSLGSVPGFVPGLSTIQTAKCTQTPTDHYVPCANMLHAIKMGPLFA